MILSYPLTLTLANSNGAIFPLLQQASYQYHLALERHLAHPFLQMRSFSGVHSYICYENRSKSTHNFEAVSWLSISHCTRGSSPRSGLNHRPTTPLEVQSLPSWGSVQDRRRRAASAPRPFSHAMRFHTHSTHFPAQPH